MGIPENRRAWAPGIEPLLASRNEAYRLPQLILDHGEQVFAWHYREDLETRLKSRPDIFRKVSG